ncbi:hypothetical protein AMECASPLE_038829 [Ameca splendens]|uniref:Uncharacterized protein n=1 Tax=Ameca splendens TaxID=208324 RepID=A0ABV0XX80_9TELE
MAVGRNEFLKGLLLKLGQISQECPEHDVGGGVTDYRAFSPLPPAVLLHVVSTSGVMDHLLLREVVSDGTAEPSAPRSNHCGGQSETMVESFSPGRLVCCMF